MSSSVLESPSCQLPGADTLLAAHRRLQGVAHRTPVFTSSYFDRRCGASLFFKAENLQRIGAFKFRGAYNTVASLTAEQRQRGVVTHSSGNHAQAVALAAQLHGCKAQIVMPHNAPQVKRQAVLGYGAEVIPCEPTLKARQETAAKIMARRGAVLVHPYDDARIIAGQGTAAMELFEQVDGLDLLLVPVGGGGLLSGCALAARHFAASTEVVGCEPRGADDAARSLASGRLLPQTRPETICDGLRGALGSLTFAVIRRHVQRIVTVDDSAVVEAMQRIFERLKLVVEPSAAVPLAAVLAGALEVSGQRLGILLSGGNIDLDHLPWQGGAPGPQPSPSTSKTAKTSSQGAFP